MIIKANVLWTIIKVTVYVHNVTKSFFKLHPQRFSRFGASDLTCQTLIPASAASQRCRLPSQTQGSARSCSRVVWAVWATRCPRRRRSSYSLWGRCSGSPRWSSSSPSPSGPTCRSGSSLSQPGIISSKSVSNCHVEKFKSWWGQSTEGVLLVGKEHLQIYMQSFYRLL